MLNCQHCKHEVAPDTEVCPGCGSKSPIVNHRLIAGMAVAFAFVAICFWSIL